MLLINYIHEYVMAYIPSTYLKCNNASISTLHGMQHCPKLSMWQAATGQKLSFIPIQKATDEMVILNILILRTLEKG
jgi:hypothetical protein